MSVFARSLKIRTKLMLVVVIALAGFAVLGGVALQTVNTVKVNGPIYNRIVGGKDLVADILPPPLYIIESYLVVYEMLDTTDAGQLRSGAEAGKALQTEYEKRRRFWETNLEEGVIKRLLVNECSAPVGEFFEAFHSRFVPALLKGDRNEARSVAESVLKPKYMAHRAAIDRLVELTNQRNAGIEGDTVKAVARRTYSMLGVALLVAVIVLACSLVLAQSIVSPLRDTIAMLRDLAGGKGDLTRRLEVKTQDEIGEFAGLFNTFVEKIRTIVARIQDNVTKLTSSSQDLSTTATQLASGSEETTTQSASVSAAAEQMSANVNAMAAASEQMSTNVKVVATSIDQLNASIGEMTKSTNQAAQIADNAAELAKLSNDKIKDLGAAADEIGKVIDVIQDMAEQTNLLALNATIEAARAGEAGRGFAVVATEVKDLANQSAKATEEIRRRIEGMQGCTDQTVQSIGKIGEVIKEVNEVSRTIASAIEEQSITTTQITQNVAQTSEAVDSVARGVAESATAASQISQNISGMEVAARQTAQGAAQTRVAGEGLASLATELSGLVGQFKV